MKKLLSFLILLAVSVLINNTDMSAQNYPADVLENRYGKIKPELNKHTVIVPSTARRGRLNKSFYYLTGIKDAGYVFVWDSGEPVLYKLPQQQEEFEKYIGILKQKNEKIALSPASGDFNMKYFYKAGYLNLDSVLVYNRAVKDEFEIKKLRDVIGITAEGLKYLKANMKPGMTELQMLDILKARFIELGAQGTAHSQLASGEGAATPHARTTSKVPAPNELIVLDIGAIKDMYIADITISFTMGGKLSKEQKTIYDIIYKALELGVKEIVMGNFYSNVEKASQDYIIDEFYKLGLVTDKNSVWQRKFWIQHGFGHFIGLDVHDVWYPYLKSIPEHRRVFIPGMVLTWEPAVYFAPDALNSRPDRLEPFVSEEEFKEFAGKIGKEYEKYKGIAIRLEENILVNDDGTNENLSGMVLKR